MKTLVYLEDVINEIKSFDNCGCITRSVNHICEDMRTEVKEVKAIPIEKLEQTREKMTHYHDGFVMFGRNDIAYAVDNCIKMLDKALEE